MPKNNKPLLNENTVRRMMKLAEIEPLSEKFVAQNYLSEKEEDVDEAVEEVSEKMIEEETTDDSLSDSEEETISEDEGAAEDELVITDDEAQALVAAMDAAAPLLDKLKSAVGEEMPEEMPETSEDEGPEEEFSEPEEEMGAAKRSDDVHEVGNVDLYEEGLSELDVQLVDDKSKNKIEEMKEEIYKRVINRLLKEKKEESK